MAAMDQLNQAMGVSAPARAGVPVDQSRAGGRGPRPPGNEELSDAQLDQIERISTMAQAALADDKGGEAIVAEASNGAQGLFSAVSGILKVVVEKMKLPREMIIPAAVTIMIIVLKFLADIGRAQTDEQSVGRLIGGLTATIGAEYGFSDEEIIQMIGQMPTEGGMRQGATQQRAQQGALGQMMQQSGQPPQGGE
jgi:hypothetical protein